MTDDPQSKLDKALDSASVAPPEPGDENAGSTAGDEKAKRQDKLDIGLKETFPSSDPPSVTQPGHNEPAPSSGYDEAEEKAREKSGR